MLNSNTIQSTDVYRSPDLFPLHLDIPTKSIIFCEMDRDCYKSTAFLDHRIKPLNQEHHSLRVSELSAAKSAPNGQVAYIFHSAYCCSTILSRYIDAIEGTFVLREPHCLYEVANIRRFNKDREMRPVLRKDRELFEQTIFSLLSRRYGASEFVVVKPTDGCNNMIAELLDLNGENKGLFIYSDLESFLSSVYKYPSRMEWARVRARELTIDPTTNGWVKKQRLESLQEWQIPVLVWLLHMATIRNAANSPSGRKLATLNSRDLTEQPADTVTTALRFLGKTITHDAAREALSEEILSAYSKDPSRRYSAEQREIEQQRERLLHASKIEAGLEWSRSMAKSPELFTPPNNLWDVASG